MGGTVGGCQGVGRQQSTRGTRSTCETNDSREAVLDARDARGEVGVLLEALTVRQRPGVAEAVALDRWSRRGADSKVVGCQEEEGGRAARRARVGRGWSPADAPAELEIDEVGEVGEGVRRRTS